MAMFEDKEKAFEAKYAHDQAKKFKIMARRNKLLGLWAAELMGLSGAAAENYAKEVVASDFDEPGDADVLRKVHGDLAAKKLDVSEHRVRDRMAELLEVAQKQVEAE